MTDTATLLYPSVPASAPAATGTAVVPAAAFYPSVGAPSRAPAIVPAADATDATPPAKALVETTPQGQTPTANLMYGDSQALKARYGEPPARPSDLDFAIPDGWGDTAEDRAERRALGTAMAQLGAGTQVGHELWADVVRAGQAPVTVSEADCMASLGQVWGSRTDAMIDVAKTAIAQLSSKFPQAIPFLISSGLGNDPSFIRKIVAAVHRKQ